MAKFTVTHPDPQFSGDMLGVAFTKGCGTVDVQAEGGLAAYSYFQRAGYATAPVEPEPEPEQAEEPDGNEEFDPAAHTVAEVAAYLADADDDEKTRVLAAEQAGQARKGIIGTAEQNGDQS